jgi:hypothetical protein
MNRDGQHDDDGDGGLHLVSISRSQWTLGNGQLGTIQFSAQLRVAAVKEKNREKQLHGNDIRSVCVAKSPGLAQHPIPFSLGSTGRIESVVQDAGDLSRRRPKGRKGCSCWKCPNNRENNNT